jgi:hypothetical protein
MSYSAETAHQMGVTIRQLMDSCGLNVREAAAILEVREDSVRTTLRGKWRAPQGWIEELSAVYDLIESRADALCDQLEQVAEGTVVELGYAADDAEAQDLGWPCVGAQMAALRRVWEDQRDRLTIALVPRGSTSATAAAADAREVG